MARSILGACLAAGVDYEDAVPLSNLAAGFAVERIETVALSPEDLIIDRGRPAQAASGEPPIRARAEPRAPDPAPPGRDRDATESSSRGGGPAKDAVHRAAACSPARPAGGAAESTEFSHTPPHDSTGAGFQRYGAGPGPDPPLPDPLAPEVLHLAHDKSRRIFESRPPIPVFRCGPGRGCPATSR
jgi:hypothetical protein